LVGLLRLEEFAQGPARDTAKPASDRGEKPQEGGGGGACLQGGVALLRRRRPVFGPAMWCQKAGRQAAVCRARRRRVPVAVPTTCAFPRLEARKHEVELQLEGEREP